MCWVRRYSVSGQRLWDRLHWPCSVHSSVYAAPWHSLAVPCSSLAPAYDDDNALSVLRGNAHIWGRAPEGVMDAPSNGRQQPARLLRQIGQPPSPSTRRLLTPWRCLIASWPLQRLTDMQACVRVSINGNDYFHRFSWQLPPGSFQCRRGLQDGGGGGTCMAYIASPLFRPHRTHGMQRCGSGGHTGGASGAVHQGPRPSGGPPARTR